MSKLINIGVFREPSYTSCYVYWATWTVLVMQATKHSDYKSYMNQLAYASWMNDYDYDGDETRQEHIVDMIATLAYNRAHNKKYPVNLDHCDGIITPNGTSSPNTCEWEYLF